MAWGIEFHSWSYMGLLIAVGKVVLAVVAACVLTPKTSVRATSPHAELGSFAIEDLTQLRAYLESC